MEQATEAKEDFTSEMLKTAPTKCLGSARKLWALEDARVFTNDVPGECGEVFPSSHPGNGFWQSFYCFFFLFSASEAPTPPPPPPPPQPLSFCICNLIDGAFFLPLHPAPNLAKVTGLTWAIPKRELGTAVDELKQSSGTAVTIQMKRGFCSSLSDSSCLQELIIAALNVALFTLFSFRGLKQYHSIEQTFRWGRIKTCSSVSFCGLGLNTRALFTNLKLSQLLLNTMSAFIYVLYNIIFYISITGPGIPKPWRS